MSLTKNGNFKIFTPPKTYLLIRSRSHRPCGPTGSRTRVLIHKEVPEDNTKFITTTGSLNSISMTVELEIAVINPSLIMSHYPWGTQKYPKITQNYNLPWPNVNFVAIDSLGKKFWCCVGGRSTLSCQPCFITLGFWIFTKTWHKIRQSEIDYFYIAFFVKQQVFDFQITKNSLRMCHFGFKNRSFCLKIGQFRAENCSFCLRTVTFISKFLFQNLLFTSQNWSFLFQNWSFLSRNRSFLSWNWVFLISKSTLFDPKIRSDKEIQSGKMFVEWIVHFVIGDRPRDEFII